MAGKREVFHVVPNAKGGWDLTKEGNKRASAHAPTKEKAIAIGKDAAKKPKLGQLIVHKQDGTIQTEYTYGQDPPAKKG